MNIRNSLATQFHLSTRLWPAWLCCTVQFSALQFVKQITVSGWWNWTEKQMDNANDVRSQNRIQLFRSPVSSPRTLSGWIVTFCYQARIGSIWGASGIVANQMFLMFVHIILPWKASNEQAWLKFSINGNRPAEVYFSLGTASTTWCVLVDPLLSYSFRGLVTLVISMVWRFHTAVNMVVKLDISSPTFKIHHC